MIRNLGKLSAFAGLVVLGGALGVNCSKGPSSSNGDAKIAFAIPGGDEVDSVSYTITSSAGPTLASGTLDTSNPNATLTLDISLAPTATGVTDTVNLTATTKNGVACTGTSAPFSVASGVASNVMLTLACGTATQPTVPGTIDITANVTVADHCPSITSAIVAPDQTSVGGTISVSATGSDPDVGDSITYSWGPTPSYFANPTAASTTYTCTLPGVQTITLSITDKAGCVARVPLMVNCIPVSLCGNGVIDPGEQCDPPNGTTCDANCQKIAATGGTTGAAGAPATGGTVGAAGAPATGGTTGAAGAPATGGATGAAGASATGGTTGAAGASGMTQSAACTSCEQAGVASGYCSNTSPVGAGTSAANFGCNGFTNTTDQQHCFALVNCLRGAACQAAILAADPSFNESTQFDDSPLPCLCGTAFNSSSNPEMACATATSGFNGVCAAQFIAASSDASDSTQNPTGNYANQNFPEGTAKQLMQCDVDATCLGTCP
jgi:hypothetical protein